MQIFVKVDDLIVRYDSIFIATTFLIEGHCVCVIRIAVNNCIEISHAYVISQYFIPKRSVVYCANS